MASCGRPSSVSASARLLSVSGGVPGVGELPVGGQGLGKPGGGLAGTLAGHGDVPEPAQRARDPSRLAELLPGRPCLQDAALGLVQLAGVHDGGAEPVEHLGLAQGVAAVACRLQAEPVEFEPFGVPPLVQEHRPHGVGELPGGPVLR